MAKIETLVLNVTDPQSLAGFYCDVLGMQRSNHDEGIAVGYGRDGADIVLRPASAAGAYEHKAQDRYWKIALTLPDVDHAHAWLTRHRVAASDPHQFRDVGYLSHFTDPEGHVIELVQHTFAGSPRTREGHSDLPLGGGCEIGLVTLRTGDIAAEMKRLHTGFGLTYLVRERVTDLGFDLYFFSGNGDDPPDPDPDALVNREWLYQRPYTVLELQHRTNGHPVSPAPTEAKGFREVLLSTGLALR